MSAYSQFIPLLLLLLLLPYVERREKLNLDVLLYVHTNPSHPGKILSIVFGVSIISRADELKFDSPKKLNPAVALLQILF
jgi:hypothetical protein